MCSQKVGTTPIKANVMFLNNTKNIADIPNITIPKVSI